MSIFNLKTEEGFSDKYYLTVSESITSQERVHEGRKEDIFFAERNKHSNAIIKSAKTRHRLTRPISFIN